VLDAPTIRLAARVVVLDEADRVLLFRTVHPNTGLVFWFTPGGGIEDGEDAREAAVRELREETGLRDIALGPEIWRRQHVFRWRDAHLDQRESFFVARVEHFTPDLSGTTGAERDDLAEWRWWPLDALQASGEATGPSELVSLVRALLTDGPPPAPVTIAA
jgi:8-oxo-dGTP pyrophosphatase MutT (NUDIX family)